MIWSEFSIFHIPDSEGLVFSFSLNSHDLLWYRDKVSKPELSFPSWVSLVWLGGKVWGKLFFGARSLRRNSTILNSAWGFRYFRILAGIHFFPSCPSLIMLIYDRSKESKNGLKKNLCILFLTLYKLYNGISFFFNKKDWKNLVSFSLEFQCLHTSQAQIIMIS